MHISFCQDQIKKTILPSDTVYVDLAEVCCKKKYTRHRSISVNMRNSLMKIILNKGAFFDCVDKVLAFFDHLPPYLR